MQLAVLGVNPADIVNISNMAHIAAGDSSPHVYINNTYNMKIVTSFCKYCTNKHTQLDLRKQTHRLQEWQLKWNTWLASDLTILSHIFSSLSWVMRRTNMQADSIFVPEFEYIMNMNNLILILLNAVECVDFCNLQNHIPLAFHCTRFPPIITISIDISAWLANTEHKTYIIPGIHLQNSWLSSGSIGSGAILKINPSNQLPCSSIHPLQARARAPPNREGRPAI